MNDESFASERQQRLGQAIAEYLEALDARQPFSREQWLAGYPEFQSQLSSFLRAQSQMRGLLEGPEESSDDGGFADTVSSHRSADSSPTGTLSAGHRFAGYQILEELGKGGMGVVYRARQESLDREVALKVPRSVSMLTAEERRRFQREADAVARLDHPNIVPIYDVGFAGSQPYLSMKLLTGGGLRDDKSLSPREAAEVTRQVAEAIEHAHERGILHRDLKPANVLRDQHGVPVVTDFGLAKQLDASVSVEAATATGALVGTPAYMAPEQVTGETTTRSDIYSLGAFMYALLTGRPPFQGQSLAQILHQVRESEPPRPRQLRPEVPADLETICLKCLQKEPRLRYESAGEVARDLHRWLNHEPIRAVPVPLWQRVQLWSRRRPAIAALSAALAVSLLIGTATAAASYVRVNRLNTDLSAANTKLQRSVTQERAARQEADENFAAATGAVNRYFVLVSETRLLAKPGLQPLRRELLQDALDYYLQFASKQRDNQDLALETAKAWWRVGRIQQMLGEFDAAKVAYQNALDGASTLLDATEDRASVPRRLAATIECDFGNLENLLSERDSAERRFNHAIELLDADAPTDDDARLTWAEAHEQLGRLQRATRRFEQAAANFQIASQAYGELREQQQENEQLADRLATCLGNMGNLLAQTGRADEAFDAVNEVIAMRQESVTRARQSGGTPDPSVVASLVSALGNKATYSLIVNEPSRGLESAKAGVTLAEELVAANPSVVEYLELLANGYASYAVILGRLERFEEADRRVDQAIETQAKLVELNPGVPRYQIRMGAMIANRAMNLRRPEEDAVAEPQFRQAIAMLESACESDPRNGEAAFALANVRSELADLLDRQGDYAEALELWRQVAAAPPNPYRLMHTAKYALTLAHAGQFSAAEDIVLRLVEDEPPDNGARLVAARVCAVIAASRPAANDNTSELAASPWTERAMRLLRELDAQSISADHVALLRNHPDFELLRQHPEFSAIRERWLDD